MSLGMIVPTRGRPANALRLEQAVRETADPLFTTLAFAVDHDDPCRDEYFATLSWASIYTVPPGFPRMSGALNWTAARLAETFSHTGFMGDDHLPRTPGWDRALCGALEAAPGVAYGNDLFKGQKLPTACVISSELIRALGYMCPPPLEHLFIDDFWKELGNATRLAYLGDVIIEHLHPAAGKAEIDPGYVMCAGAPQAFADQSRWIAWQAGTWPGERARLLAALDA